MRSFLRLCCRAVFVCAVVAMAVARALAAQQDDARLVEVKMSLNETLLPALAESLGYFRKEGLRITIVDPEQFEPEDFLIQEPMNKGHIDAAYHWFHHALFGARHNWPVTAVMMVNDAPGVQVLVANRMKDQVRSARDFAGKRVAEGAGYSTKSVVVNYLALNAGLPRRSYTPVMQETAGRQEAVVRGLAEDQVDVMAFLEPMTSALLKTGLVAPLYDLTSREKTERVFGAPWPAQAILVAPRLIREHPDTVQHLVNAWVRTMRYVNTHSAEDIIAQLPEGYFEKRGRQAETDKLRNTMSAFARANYAFPAAGVKLVVDSAVASDFDDSPEGRWRRGVENPRFRDVALYDNRFVEKAMKQIPR
jgi:NitT/TauT family transport system substrate-binding protein